MPTTQLDTDEVRVLRVLAGGRKVLPIRDAPFEASLSSKGLIEYGTTFHGGAVPDLSAAGVATLLEIDGPLTEAERADWLRWPKTRFGTDGSPQKLLQGMKNPMWRTFSVPRARALLQRWARYGIRQSW